jgi:MOSC domain-containing protein YiiM
MSLNCNFLQREPSLGFTSLIGWPVRVVDGGSVSMVAPIQLAVSPRERFLAAVQREFTAFEHKESEFSKRLREERAAELHLPLHESAARNIAIKRMR